MKLKPKSTNVECTNRKKRIKSSSDSWVSRRSGSEDIHTINDLDIGDLVKKVAHDKKEIYRKKSAIQMGQILIDHHIKISYCTRVFLCFLLECLHKMIIVRI